MQWIPAVMPALQQRYAQRMGACEQGGSPYTLAACAADAYTDFTHCSDEDAKQLAPELQSFRKGHQEWQAACDKDPTACGFPPQLTAPLSDKTPDINSPAENNVCCDKGHVERKVKEWVLDPSKDEALEKALTYWNLVNEKVKQMNTPDGLLTCYAAVMNG